MMMSLGVYVLGAADASERRRVEAHLAGCPACRAELTFLTPLPGLLARVPDDTLAAGPSAPVRARGRSRRAWRAAAVAASLAAIAGAVGGFWLAPRAASQRPATVTLSGTNPAGHVSATAALTATSWGTSIELRVDGLPLDVPCRLIVRSRAGATEVTGVWDAWRTGPITVPASASWWPSDIARLEVATSAGDLVTISARHTALPQNRPQRPRPHFPSS
jgi:predicted anti-sigma-YlaC factor YlaD